MHYIVYSYDPFNCAIKRRRFNTLNEAENFFDECWEHSVLVKVENGEESFIKEKNND